MRFVVKVTGYHEFSMIAGDLEEATETAKAIFGSRLEAVAEPAKPKPDIPSESTIL